MFALFEDASFDHCETAGSVRFARFTSGYGYSPPSATHASDLCPYFKWESSVIINGNFACGCFKDNRDNRDNSFFRVILLHYFLLIFLACFIA